MEKLSKEAKKEYLKCCRSIANEAIYKKQYRKKYRQLNKNKVRKAERAFRHANPDYHKKQWKNWYAKNKKAYIKKRKDYCASYYRQHKIRLKKLKKEWEFANREALRKKKLAYFRKNKKHIYKWKRAWCERIRERIKVRRAAWCKNNIRYIVTKALRNRLKTEIKRKNLIKKQSAILLIGRTVEFFKNYIVKKFKSGMTWKNYGKWHLDHIKPCASFDLSKLSEQKKCFHYTNFQPLWAKENLEKGWRY